VKKNGVTDETIVLQWLVEANFFFRSIQCWRVCRFNWSVLCKQAWMVME